jgi:hypothetical protein
MQITTRWLLSLAVFALALSSSRAWAGEEMKLQKQKREAPEIMASMKLHIQTIKDGLDMSDEGQMSGVVYREAQALGDDAHELSTLPPPQGVKDQKAFRDALKELERHAQSLSAAADTSDDVRSQADKVFKDWEAFQKASGS